MTNTYPTPPDPNTGHHLERDKECGLKAHPECTGKLDSSYRQKLLPNGTIVSFCHKCFDYLQEQINNKKVKKSE